MRGSCFESIAIGSAPGSTCWARASTSGTSAPRSCLALASAAALRRRSTRTWRQAPRLRRRLARGEGLARPRPVAARHGRTGVSACTSGRRRCASCAGPTRCRSSPRSPPRWPALVNLASAVTPNIAWRDHLLLQFAPLEAMRLSHAAAVPASLLLFVTRAVPLAPPPGRVPRWLSSCCSGSACSTCSRASTSRRRPPASPSPGCSGSAAARSASATTRSACAPRCAGSARSSRPASCSAARRLAGARPRARASARSCARPSTHCSGSPGRSTSTTSSARLDEAVGVCRPAHARSGAPTSSSARWPCRARCRTGETRAGRPRARPPPRRRHARLLQAPPRPALPLQQRPAGVPRVPGRDRRPARLGRPRRPGGRDPRAAPRAEPVRRGPRPADRRARRRRAAAARSGASSASARSTSATRPIVETRSFSLDGRAIRKVRQSVTRLEKQGYSAAPAAARRALRCAELAELDASAAAGGTARPSEASRCRSTPSGGRSTATASSSSGATAMAGSAASSTSCRATAAPAVSLSLMRRDRDMPNGLMEFLVARGHRAASRPRHRGGLAQLRGLRAPHPRPARRRRAADRPGAAGGGLLLPDRAPSPLQREVLPSLGASLPAVRAGSRPGAGRSGGDVGRGPAAEAGSLRR